ncbi:MAG: hypothetical protein BIFFINMI_04266 [Phycisphaerae bacterium]|nr:hypothetical protein [Phycisphaerae bacterium]
MAQMQSHAELLRLLGHPTRLALLAELAKGPKCVSDMQGMLDVRQANVSQHLAILRRERIVDYHEAGKLRCYYLVRPGLVDALDKFLNGRYPAVRPTAEEVRRAARSRTECSIPGGSHQRGRAGSSRVDRAAAPGMGRADHWNKVYTEKADKDLSWYQGRPTGSLAIMDRLGLSKDAAIIDVGGGGPSALVGTLLKRGFTDISVLDVSSAALERCRKRLAGRAKSVTWLESDVTRFVPPRQYDLWHDRAVFHFLTDSEDREAYVAAISRGLKPGAHAIIATFAPEGPPKCSGLDVVRWGPTALAETLAGGFSLVECLRETHRTPWGKPQAFAYCLFQFSP